MLESCRLVLKPCAPSAPATQPAEKPTPTAQVFDADRGMLLGSVYRRRPHSRWWSWLVSSAYSVHEADEEPLLFTLQCPRFLVRTWEVNDADGHVLGVVRTARRRPFLWVATRGPMRQAWVAVHDSFGQLRCVLTPSVRQREGWTFLTQDGTELAQVTLAPEATTLAFEAKLDGEPIVKMLLLAAVLPIAGIAV